MTQEFEVMDGSRLGPRTSQILREAFALFDERVTDTIQSDWQVESIITDIVNRLTSKRLTIVSVVATLIQEHPQPFWHRCPKETPPPLSPPSAAVRQNIREWLDYTLWARWYSSPPNTPKETTVYVLDELPPDLDVGFSSNADGTLCDECYPDQRKAGISYRIIYAPEAAAYGLVCRSCNRLLAKQRPPLEETT